MPDCLKFPLRFTNGKAATVLQDSDLDHAQRALLVLSYPQGACVDLPAFGTPDLTFVQGGIDPDLLTGVLGLWEPEIAADTGRAALVDAVDSLQVNVAGGS